MLDLIEVGLIEAFDLELAQAEGLLETMKGSTYTGRTCRRAV